MNPTAPSASPRSPASVARAATDLVRERARSHPDGVVLEVDGGHVSYRALDQRLDRLSQWIIDHTGEDHARIVVQIAGTEALFLSALAVQRAGRVLVPVGPSAPPNWVGQVVRDCSASLLLTDTPTDPGAIPCALAHPGHIGAAPPPGGVRRPVPEIANIFYTSGSTGEPKGVVVSAEEHRAREDAFSRQIAPTDSSEPTQVRIATLGEGSVGWTPELPSRAIQLDAVVVGYDLRRDGLQGLGPWMAQERIAAVAMVPTLLRHLVAVMPPELQLPDLRVLRLGGEQAFWEDLEPLWSHVGPEMQVSNTYGMTELGAVTAFTVTRDVAHGSGTLPVGTPIRDITITIEDQVHQPLPAGAVGEIVVRSLSSGTYLETPADGMRFSVDADGRRCYRTRDLGRMDPDGTLVHLGRADDAVLVSGHLVNPRAVRDVLVAAPDVEDAVVESTTDHQGHTRLVAQVVPAPGREPDISALRRALAMRLPAAAVPDHILVVAQSPPPAGGDDPSRAGPAGAPDRLRTDTGQQRAARGASDTSDPVLAAIVTIWAGVLGGDVGPDDDFFELGGDSMRGVRMLAEIHRTLGVDRPLSVLLEAATPRALARQLTEVTAPPGRIPTLTSIQRGEACGTPLIVLHDASGSILYARLIATELPDHVPVYAIAADALLGIVDPTETVADVVGRYATAVHHHGLTRCALFGQSAGGILAFELALQLQAGGVDVVAVAVGDSPAPGSQRPPARSWARSVSRRLREAGRVPWAERPALLGIAASARARAVVADRLAAPGRRRRETAYAAALEGAQNTGSLLPVEHRYRYALGHYIGLVRTYRPARPYRGRFLLLRAADRGATDRGWGTFVDGPVEVMALPAFHYQLLEDEAVQRTGRAIADFLATLEAAPAT